ncbi:Uncharacterised protein [Vibrio cholerae]|uniref:Uncharacterized protein n=1 Tax=Vibrio cholerae TaxID=666 RepID=A0A655S2K6_VIBCL|nr:Uncharacterised protein [Vibrio cholerae]
MASAFHKLVHASPPPTFFSTNTEAEAVLVALPSLTVTVKLKLVSWLYSPATNVTLAPCTVALMPTGRSQVKLSGSWSASLDAEASTTTVAPALTDAGAETAATGAVFTGVVDFGLTVTTTVSIAVAPLLSFTVSLKVSVCFSVTSAALKLALALFAPVKVTAGPAVCSHK